MAEVENSVVSSNQGENSPTNETQVANQAQDGEVAQAGQEQQQQQRPGGWGIFKTLLVRMVIIYLISSFFRRSSTPQPKPGESDPALQPSSNIFYKDMLLDMYIYLSESEDFKDYNDPKALFWLEEEIQYGNWHGGMNEDGTYMKTGEIYLSENVLNNGSLYMHVYFVSAGKSPDPEDETYDKKFKVYKMKALNKYKKRRFHNLKNLITGTTETSPDLIQKSNESTFEILSYWHPNQTINLIDDHTPWVRGSIPAPLDEYIEFKPGTNNYYPVLYFNDYWNMNSEYMPINETTPVLTLSLSYAPMSLFKWQMYAAQSMRSRWYSFMGESMMEENDEDQDSLKTTFLETSHWLLGITIVVSIIHSVFEFLAFKNDIQFWRNRKSLEGLSVRSVFFNVFQSVIIVLYVLDHETNFVVKVSVFIGLAIEIWKIHKVIDIKVDKENKLLGFLPRITFQDKSTYTESLTKKYDMLAFKYLAWLLYPLLGGYAVYSLFYMEHKGYYSWILGMLYGFLLTFGFIMMTPQLFINYKLKSVAHLPWRMLTYKALNTFIDDLFAFVIKMPTLYRIACFRDDIVFCIYLYQRWIYRVDPKRVNEYGTSQDMLETNEQLQNGDVQPIEDAPADQPIEDEPADQPIEDAPADQEDLTEPTDPKPDKEKKED